MCLFSTDSPFSNGQGNDYLFVGNMVYTVSICLVFSLCCCISLFVSCFYFCVFWHILEGFFLHNICVHTGTVQFPQRCYKSPVNLESSSQSVSSPPHPSLLCSLLLLSFYSQLAHLNVSGLLSVYLLCCVCTHCRRLGGPEHFNRHC